MALEAKEKGNGEVEVTARPLVEGASPPRPRHHSHLSRLDRARGSEFSTRAIVVCAGRVTSYAPRSCSAPVAAAAVRLNQRPNGTPARALPRSLARMARHRHPPLIVRAIPRRRARSVAAARARPAAFLALPRTDRRAPRCEDDAARGAHADGRARRPGRGHLVRQGDGARHQDEGRWAEQARRGRVRGGRGRGRRCRTQAVGGRRCRRAGAQREPTKVVALRRLGARDQGARARRGELASSSRASSFPPHAPRRFPSRAGCQTRALKDGLWRRDDERESTAPFRCARVRPNDRSCLTLPAPGSTHRYRKRRKVRTHRVRSGGRRVRAHTDRRAVAV